PHCSTMATMGRPTAAASSRASACQGRACRISAVAGAIHQHDGIGLAPSGSLDIEVVLLELTPALHQRYRGYSGVGGELQVQLGEHGLGLLGREPFQQALGASRVLGM